MSGLRSIGEGIRSALRWIGQGFKYVGGLLKRAASGLRSAGEWMRDWLPGLIAAPLAGLVDILAGSVRAIGGIFSWKGAEVKEGLKDMGLGALSALGLKEILTEKWEHGPTGGMVPKSLKKVMEDVRSLEPPFTAPNAWWKNGMHGWHAGTNAAITNRLGPVMAPLIWVAGLYHESPADWESFKAEQAHQGTVNHVLDSLTDIVANTFGILVGLLLPRKIASSVAARAGNYIPGPGEPDPAFGLGHDYTGNPADAWGQYPH